METRQPALMDDLETAGDRSLNVEGGLALRSYLAVPLVWQGQAFGLLEVDSTEPRAFHPPDLELLQAVASALSGPIELARRFGREQAARAEAEAAQQQLAALAAENARLYHAAQQAVRLRDEFLSVAAHELKTPVTSLRALAQLTARQLHQQAVIEPERVRHALQVLDTQADKLARLVARLLDVTRIEAGKLALEREPVDLVALVQGAVEEARMRATHHLLQVRAPASLAAWVDPLRLEQVLTNLLDNALHYTPPGGSIEVELAEAPHGGRASPYATMAPASPPSTASRVHGLGLYISRQIVELHGGELTAKFPPDGGTRFVVTLSGAEMDPAP